MKGNAAKKNTWRTVLANWDLYLMQFPFLLLFFFFTVVPVLGSMVISLTDFDLFQFPAFVGLDNYKRLFVNDSVFIICLKNTLIFAFVTGPVSYFLSLLVAWMVNEMRPHLRSFLTFLFYAPSISVSLYMIWMFIFNGDAHGWANGLLLNLGITREAVNWFTDARYNMAIIMIIQLWTSMGVGFLAFIAGFQGIDSALYESGAIDGIKNRWQEFIHITLPSMGPQLLFGAVMQIAFSFSAGKISVALAGNPSTDYSVDTIITHILEYGTIRYEMGYASALATILFAMMVLSNYLIRRVLRKYT